MSKAIQNHAIANVIQKLPALRNFVRDKALGEVAHALQSTDINVFCNAILSSSVKLFQSRSFADELSQYSSEPTFDLVDIVFERFLHVEPDLIAHVTVVAHAELISKRNLWHDALIAAFSDNADDKYARIAAFYEGAIWACSATAYSHWFAGLAALYQDRFEDALGLFEQARPGVDRDRYLVFNALAQARSATLTETPHEIEQNTLALPRFILDHLSSLAEVTFRSARKSTNIIAMAQLLKLFNQLPIKMMEIENDEAKELVDFCCKHLESADLLDLCIFFINVDATFHAHLLLNFIDIGQLKQKNREKFVRAWAAATPNLWVAAFEHLSEAEAIQLVGGATLEDTVKFICVYCFSAGQKMDDLVTAWIAGAGSRFDTRSISEEFYKHGIAIDLILGSNVKVSIADPSNVIDPEVTIVVPAYNAEQFIEWTLDSINEQAFTDFECIIVNDGSTDSTAAIANRFVKKSLRFRLVSHRANSGLAAARNSGMRAARGKYICFLDADDLIMKNGLVDRVQMLRQDESSDHIGTYCGSVSIDELTRHPPEPSNSKLTPTDFVSAKGLCPFNANQPMFNTDNLQKIGGFDESLKQAEDYELWMRVLRQGYYLSAAPRTGVTYRSRKGSMVRSAPLDHLSKSASWYSAVHERTPIKSGPYQPSLDKAWIDYHRQISFAPRVLEFAGMALAGGENLETIVQTIDEQLPDFEMVARHITLRDHVVRGALRAHNVAVGSHIKFSQAPILSQVDTLLGALVVNYNNRSSNEESHVDSDCSHSELIRRPDVQSTFDIIFLPHKDYHLWTISLLLPELEARGLKVGVVDITCHYRDEGVRVRAAELDVPLIGVSNFLMGAYRPRLVVAFNDWDPIVRSLLVMAQRAGAKTAAIVEGIQDYWDADTGQRREAYRTVDSVLVTGAFDKKYFANSTQDVTAVGIPRIQTLIERGPTPRPEQPVALINSNFSYNVLTDHRDAWVKQAIEASLEAGFEPVVSRHPADLGAVGKEFKTEDSFYDAMDNATVLVTRFASGILEALAMDRRLVYFNPHGETVDKFKDPLGAYECAGNLGQLVAELKAIKKNPVLDRKASRQFLELHAGIDGEPPAKKIAIKLHDLADHDRWDEAVFKSECRKIDVHTSCFSELRALRIMCMASYGDLLPAFKKALDDDPMDAFIRSGTFVR